MRELLGEIERVAHVACAEGRRRVRADLLAPDAGQPAERPPAAATEREPPTAEGIERAIRESATVAAAAMALGIHRSHLYRLMRQHGIDARARRGEGRSPATRGS